MIIEKPKCLKCQVYLDKIADGWICPECKCEFYEEKEPIYVPYPIYPYYPYIYPYTYEPYPHEPWKITWSSTTGDPLPNSDITIC